MRLILRGKICKFPCGVADNRRLQVVRLERELAASKAEAQFNKLSLESK
jgi:hypothetical protein